MAEYEIEVARYHLPNGRKSYEMHEVTKDVFQQADELIQAGYHFEVEVLTTGESSWTVGDDDGDWHFLITVGLSSEYAVPSLIKGAYTKYKANELNPDNGSN